MHAGDGWAALEPLGWDEGRRAELSRLGGGVEPGRVLRADRGGGLVATAAGAVHAEGPGLATGDWVALRDGRLAAVLERRTAFSRRAAGRPDARQVVAVNVDVVVVAHALDRPLRVTRLHRGLAIAWESGAVPVIALTKSDLGVDPEVDAAVGALGADVLHVSARTGEGLDDLAARAGADRRSTGAPIGTGRTLVLLGESGAGKSSLVNALVGGEPLATAGVRAGDAKGRHTTTARHLVPLPGGGALIDTPGVRELGLWGDQGEGVAVTFADVEELAAGCRFSDCRHEAEPGCAVLAAVAAGALAEDRLESWRTLTREVAALERRADERTHRAHGRAGARIAREAQRGKRRARGQG